MLIDEVKKYNADIIAFLSEVWSYVPKGRKKQLLKNERIKALLDRYHIPYKEDA